MATQFSTATAIPQHAPYQHHAYRKSTQYSPNGSATNTPINVSPTSPRTTTPLPLQRHQGIYQPRTAIGVPAALRKTEKPGGKSPPKLDSGVGSPNSGWNVNGGITPVTTNGSATNVSQVGSEDMNSIYNDVPMSPTAGPITRNHWQLPLSTAPMCRALRRLHLNTKIDATLEGRCRCTPADSSTSVCSASSCHEPFGFFQRRHHCRKCGGIFCWQHSTKLVRLDELARFHPEGVLHRACDRCHGSFREWEHLRSSRSNSEDSSGSAAAVQIEAPAQAKRPENHRVGSLAQSLQGAWNWSTF
ncbi:hypothetical protein FB567DRAFT_562406 [Paraphoma chrysanthemicola]|uniref:FYVE-type domain-containing protein n=1 Tax=Paraphoma chrysanthemicola TaxID=798071 RepID=A0A8K0QZ40_9PLEO|nr:hypothetical protein FB567DRAFT_562406 [Paraphoma chrysanthemicola]